MLMFKFESESKESRGCFFFFFGDSRGKEQRAVHEGAVVVIVDEVVHFCGVITHFGSVGDLDGHRVVGIVEVDHVDVKDEHGRRRDHVTWADHRMIISS